MGATNNVEFNQITLQGQSILGGTNGVFFIYDQDEINDIFFFDNPADKAVARTNLGLPLTALTNTNNASFQRAIFQTNTAPSAGANLGDAKAWIEISVVTNSVTNSFRIPVFQ